MIQRIDEQINNFFFNFFHTRKKQTKLMGENSIVNNEKIRRNTMNQFFKEMKY